MMARRSTRWTGTRSADTPHAETGAVDGPGSPTAHPGLAELADRNAAAVGQLAAGRLQPAVIALEALLKDCRWLLGDEHPETLIVGGNLAVAYLKSGQQEAGAQLMRANLVDRERVFGDEHPLTLTARDALATTHRLAGRLPEAMWLYSRVAQQRNRVLGPSHPDTLTTRLGLGLTFDEAGDTAVALDVVTAALQDCERAGVEGPHSAILRSCLSDMRRAAAGPVAEPPAGGTTVPQPRRGSARPASDPLSNATV